MSRKVVVHSTSAFTAQCPWHIGQRLFDQTGQFAGFVVEAEYSKRSGLFVATTDLGVWYEEDALGVTVFIGFRSSMNAADLADAVLTGHDPYKWYDQSFTDYES